MTVVIKYYSLTEFNKNYDESEDQVTLLGVGLRKVLEVTFELGWLIDKDSTFDKQECPHSEKKGKGIPHSRHSRAGQVKKLLYSPMCME